MSGAEWRFVWITAIALILAAILLPLALRLKIGTVSFDPLLIVAICCALLSNRVAGACIGFVAGFLHGALADRMIGELCASRSLSGYLIGWIPTFVVRESIWTALLAVFAGTIVAETLFLFLHPGSFMVGFWVLSTVTKAAYNGVVAIPVYALLRRYAPPVQH